MVSLINVRVNMRDWTRFWWLLIFLLAALTYSNSLQNEWHFDDYHSIVKNTSIRSLGNMGRFFTDPRTFSQLAKEELAFNPMYRPLLLLGYAFTYFLGGYSLSVWHSFQILLHFMFCSLLYLFFVELTCRKDISLAAAVIWTIHPINTQAVNYLCSRSEIQVSIFYLLALISVMRLEANDGKKQRVAWQLGSLLFTVCGLLTKSVAVTIPAAIVLWDWLLGPGAHEKKGLAKALRRALPHIILVVLYLLLRMYILGHAVFPVAKASDDYALRLFSDHPSAAAHHSLGGRSVISNLLVQSQALLRYGRLVLLPYGFSPIHDIEPMTSLFSWPTIVTFPLILLLILGFLLCVKRAPMVSFCGLFSFTVLAPTTLMPLNIIVNEQRVYLAGAVLSLFIVQLLTLLANRIPLERKKRLAAFLLLCCLLSYLSFARNRYWRNAVSLWGDAAKKAPRSHLVHWLYGEALIESNFLEEGLWQLERAAKLGPISVGQLHRLAKNHLRLGNQLLADTYVKAALTKVPDNVFLLTTQARVYESLQKMDEALQISRELKKRLAWHKDVVAGAEHLEEKFARLRSNALLFRKRSKTRLEYGRILAEAGLEEQAIVTLLDHLKRVPKDVTALTELGWLLLKTSRCKEARKYLLKANELEPKDRQILARLVLACGGANNRDEAAKYARQMKELNFHLSLQVRAAAGLEPY